MDNKDVGLLKIYLNTLELSEYDKIYVIDNMRDKTKSELKREFFQYFPSVKGKHGLHAPDELLHELDVVILSEEEVQLFRDSIQGDANMNDNDVPQMGEIVPTATPVPTTTPKDTKGLTLDNFRERTGARFRMTKEQKGRGLTREAAFAEWLAKNES